MFIVTTLLMGSCDVLNEWIFVVLVRKFDIVDFDEVPFGRPSPCQAESKRKVRDREVLCAFAHNPYYLYITCVHEPYRRNIRRMIIMIHCNSEVMMILMVTTTLND